MPRLEISAGSPFARYAAGSPENGQTADKVAHILREAIFDGALQPSSWLRESELARELGVSRTPVREALTRLAAEGLVDIAARQGAMVSRMGVSNRTRRWRKMPCPYPPRRS